MLHQFSLERVFKNVITGPEKRIVPALFRLKHVVMRLMLKFLWGESGFEMRAQKGHPVEWSEFKRSPMQTGCK
jgi:hypothetical protein